ncbi:hypothetical protein M8494_17250 [Serratia ureilytica]
MDADIANPAAGAIPSKSPTSTSRRCVTWWLMPQNGIPTPTFSDAIAYYDSYAAVLLANLIQAQARLLRCAHL